MASLRNYEFQGVSCKSEVCKMRVLVVLRFRIEKELYISMLLFLLIPF